MNLENFLEKYSLTKFPVGLGGCKNYQYSFESCEYNITIFDNKTQEDEIVSFENEIVRLHHGSLKETKSNLLVQYSNMKIILDDQWELRMLLSRIKEKKEKIFKDFTKNCIIDSLFCLTKSNEGIKSSDPFVSTWQKCAAHFIADAIFGINLMCPSPAHMLDIFRGLEKNRINEKFSIVNECIGIERATVSLLPRMCKSTIGLSDLIEGNEYSKIIQTKYDFFVKNSLLSDCYFYLGCINRNNIMKIKDNLHRRPELIHILKIGFDIENDPSKIGKNIEVLHKTGNDLLTTVTSS